MFGDFVIPDTLASPSDYQTWTGVAGPANIAQVLRSCSSLVLDATEGAFYDVDVLTGLATNTLVKNAMRDATCIQAAAWVALGIEPLTGGVITSSVKKSKKIATAQIEYADTVEAVAARKAAYEALVPDAARKLQQRNLLGNKPYGMG